MNLYPKQPETNRHTKDGQKVCIQHTYKSVIREDDIKKNIKLQDEPIFYTELYYLVLDQNRKTVTTMR